MNKLKECCTSQHLTNIIFILLFDFIGYHIRKKLNGQTNFNRLRADDLSGVVAGYSQYITVLVVAGSIPTSPLQLLFITENQS